MWVICFQIMLLLIKKETHGHKPIHGVGDLLMNFKVVVENKRLSPPGMQNMGCRNYRREDPEEDVSIWENFIFRPSELTSFLNKQVFYIICFTIFLHCG